MSATVRFDVGGKIYKVARSLLDQYPDTMLARLVSKTWSPGNDVDSRVNEGEEKSDNKDGCNQTSGDDKDAAVYIERDGQRFRYCLDYMRDGCVHLPPSIPKKAFLQDLAYYGFEDIDPSRIYIGGSIPAFKSCFDHIDRQIRAFENEMSDLEIRRKCVALAKYCLISFKQHGSLRINLSNSYYEHSENSMLTFSGHPQYRETLTSIAEKMTKSPVYLEHFNTYLKENGMKYSKNENGHITLQFV